MVQARKATKRAPRKTKSPVKAPREVTKSTSTAPTRGMSDEHKHALAIGRDEGRAVRNYLEALEAHKPKRGRKRTPEGIERRIDQIERDLPYADPLTKVHLTQERMDLQAELQAQPGAVDLSSLEDGFVKAAKGYSDRKGISYTAWREIGVDAAVLRRAGIARTRG